MNYAAEIHARAEQCLKEGLTQDELAGVLFTIARAVVDESITVDELAKLQDWPIITVEVSGRHKRQQIHPSILSDPPALAEWLTRLVENLRSES